jgi:hypothetical protein
MKIEQCIEMKHFNPFLPLHLTAKIKHIASVHIRNLWVLKLSQPTIWSDKFHENIFQHFPLLIPLINELGTVFEALKLCHRMTKLIILRMCESNFFFLSFHNVFRCKEF